MNNSKSPKTILSACMLTTWTWQVTGDAQLAKNKNNNDKARQGEGVGDEDNLYTKHNLKSQGFAYLLCILIYNRIETSEHENNITK